MHLIQNPRKLEAMAGATKAATVAGYGLFEDPLRGDEDTLILKGFDGRFWRTDFWEAPAAEELLACLPMGGV